VFSTGKEAMETIFTAFVVPALLTPVVWLARAVTRAVRHAPPRPFEARTRRLEVLYLLAGFTLLVGGLLARAGVPVERGGRPLTFFVWALYLAANLLFAGIVVAMTSGYGSVPDGRPKDSMFLRFVGEVCFQVVMTAGAFLLLYRLLRVVFHRTFPGLDVVPEGI
jgi:hypothetical protein